MKTLVYSFSGLALIAGAAHAQPAEAPADAVPAAAAHTAHTLPPAPAEPAVPATPAEPSAALPPTRPNRLPRPSQRPVPPLSRPADLSEADIDSFAQATVKLQKIQADATIAADLKQAAMRAAVTEAGLDPARYNAIGKAAQADPALRARVQTAMARYTTPPSDG
jgi:hypothetical protein